MARGRKPQRVTNNLRPRHVSARKMSTPAEKIVPAIGPAKKAKAKGRSRGRPAKSVTGVGVNNATAATPKKKKSNKDFGKRTKKRVNPTGPGPETVYNDELDNDGDEYEVEAILDSRKDGECTFYQVQWKGWSQKTWEPAVHLRNSADAITEFDLKFPDKA